MITKKEAIEIAKKAYKPGLVSENGYTAVIDIGDDDGYYGFDTVLESDEDFNTSMLCVSKQTGEPSWLGGGWLYTTYDMTNETKEPI